MKIFVCFTPFQLFYAQSIILNFFNNKEDRVLLIYSQGYLKNFEPDSKVEMLELRDGGMLSFFRNHLTAKRKILNTVKNNNDIEFFLSHTGNLLTNFLFHNNRINKKAKINLFYEGVLYLYDYKEKFNKHHIKRMFFGFFIGIRYKYNCIIFPYDDVRVGKIYTPFPDFTKGDKDKMIDCQIKKQESLDQSINRCLVLGGPLEEMGKLYELFLNEIEQQQFEEIIYKGHPGFNTHYKKYKTLFRNLASKRKLDFIEIHEDEIVEQAIENNTPQVIYSYFSSALINLKLTLGNECKIKCYISRDQKIEATLHDLYERLNIEIDLVN